MELKAELSGEADQGGDDGMMTGMGGMTGVARSSITTGNADQEAAGALGGDGTGAEDVPVFGNLRTSWD